MTPFTPLFEKDLKKWGKYCCIKMMFIDEEKIHRKSRSLSGGYKGIVPKFEAGKRKTAFDWVRIFIGVALTACMVIGTAMLFYTLISTGSDIANSKSQKKVEYIEVIYKPNQK